MDHDYALVVNSNGVYILSFLGSFATSLFFVPVVRKIAIRRMILDHPGKHKSHTEAVPYLGGLAMVLAFTVTVILAVVIRQDLSFNDGTVTFNVGGLFQSGSNTIIELFVVLGLALCLGVMGLVDDLRGIRPSVRLMIELIIAVVVFAYGVKFETNLPIAINFVITVIWVVGITNALNLLDNIDGLAAGITGIAALVFYFIAHSNGQPFTALLAVGLAGSSFGFLKSNFHPAKIYMGDAGSLYLGFLLAYIGLKIKVDPKETSQILVPFVVMGVALLDTSMVVISRIRRGVSPFSGGKDHLSHRLMRLGLSVRRSVTFILLGSCMLGIVAVALSRSDSAVGYWLFCAVLTAGIATTVLLTTKRAAELP